jgi:hypothetical protein
VELRSVGRAVAGLALVGVAVRAWRWLRAPGWNENVEAAYGPNKDLTPEERNKRAGAAGFVGSGEAGPRPG